MIRRNFTLVEILTVIAIIAILMGLLLPVMSTAQRKGKENKARAAIQSIKFAIEQYENDYGLLPKIGTSTSDDNVFNTTMSNSESSGDYDKLMEILTFTKIMHPTASNNGQALITSGTDNYFEANLKKIRYLEAPANKVKDISNTEGYFILDPWGRRYGIVIDNNYDGMLGNDGDPKTFNEGESNPKTVRAKVAVFSYGAQKKGAVDDKTYHITSWK